MLAIVPCYRSRFLLVVSTCMAPCMNNCPTPGHQTVCHRLEGTIPPVPCVGVVGLFPCSVVVASASKPQQSNAALFPVVLSHMFWGPFSQHLKPLLMLEGFGIASASPCAAHLLPVITMGRLWRYLIVTYMKCVCCPHMLHDDLLTAKRSQGNGSACCAHARDV